MNGVVQRVMVFVDGTEESITAAQYAIMLCHDLHAELEALYVINTRALSDLVKTHIFLAAEQDEYQHDLEADADRYLQHVIELASSKGIAVTTTKTRGTVYQEIKKRVVEQEIDLLVIGELARIRSRRDEFFDEAERAMRSVPCAVLIVKDEDRVWDLFEA